MAKKLDPQQVVTFEVWLLKLQQQAREREGSATREKKEKGTPYVGALLLFWSDLTGLALIIQHGRWSPRPR